MQENGKVFDMRRPIIGENSVNVEKQTKEGRCLIKTSVKELQNLEMRTVEPLYLKQLK